MRISGSGNPPGIEAGGQSNAPHPASPAKGTENAQTTDLLAISEAAGAMSSRGDRVQQLRLQFESGSYSESSAGIAQQLISGALNRGA
jgi:anti-sigma28 factor (negative regulator of flagellin synthesis)